MMLVPLIEARTLSFVAASVPNINASILENPFKTLAPKLDTSPPPTLYFIKRTEFGGNFSPKDLLSIMSLKFISFEFIEDRLFKYLAYASTSGVPAPNVNLHEPSDKNSFVNLLFTVTHLPDAKFPFD